VENETILVDALMTNDQADALARWAQGFGKRITGVYITHGHSDHWLGLARLLEHFPEVRGFATAEVAARAAHEANATERPASGRRGSRANCPRLRTA
jgi:glyoxylase-like metal-dependent hydrolase (beta-lactamase superfamily II)